MKPGNEKVERSKFFFPGYLSKSCPRIDENIMKISQDDDKRENIDSDISPRYIFIARDSIG